jgi:hypothetical protein
MPARNKAVLEWLVGEAVYASKLSQKLRACFAHVRVNMFEAVMANEYRSSFFSRIISVHASNITSSFTASTH